MRPIDATTLKAEFTGNYYNVGQIKAIIDTAPTMGEWISVKDRLPERYERVLTYDERCGVKENWAIRLKPYADWSQGYHITHWMPLPEPPKEEENER